WRAACLEEVLVVWERNRNHQTESEGSRSLEAIDELSSARGERRGDGSLARTGLTLHQNPRRKRIIMQHR
ncbi:hypothetical protein TNCV_3573921, partial [Trichonephila clavipes]